MNTEFDTVLEGTVKGISPELNDELFPRAAFLQPLLDNTSFALSTTVEGILTSFTREKNFSPSTFSSLSP
jgi:hypothetical protein